MPTASRTTSTNRGTANSDAAPRTMPELPGPPRGADWSVVFHNAFWVFGGKTGGLGGTGFSDGVAFLEEVEPPSAGASTRGHPPVPN